MQNIIYKVQVKTAVALVRAKAALSNRSGQGALDTAIQVLISIVLGALILGGLYLILNATVLFCSRYKHDRNCYA